MTRKEKINYIKMKKEAFSLIYNNKKADQVLTHLNNDELNKISDKELDQIYHKAMSFNLMYNVAIGA